MKPSQEYSTVLNETLQYATTYLNELDSSDVSASASLETLRGTLNKPLNINQEAAQKVITDLIKNTEGGLINSTGGRFFAWVIGGSLPSALAADWLTSLWDQNAALYASSPAEAIIEEIAGKWLKEILRLPKQSSFAFTTGCQMAHFTCLAAARNELLKKQSWDVEKKGLIGAPNIHLITNEHLHGSIERAARFLGLGSDCIIPIETNKHGQIIEEKLKIQLDKLKGEAIILQLCAGDINSGAYDHFESVIPLAHSYNAWVHIDGAFGLWVNASNSYRYLLKGVEKADSWATDGHKWLNVPYDCGYAFVKNNRAHQASMALKASYLTHAENVRDPFDWNVEWSRRGRAVPTYAAIRQLGTSGIASLVEKCCQYAYDLTIGIGNLKGAKVVVTPQINQGLIRFIHPFKESTKKENDDLTDKVIKKINDSGILFVGGTTWKEQRCMRVSVCNWQTSDQDIQLSIQAIKEVLEDIV